MMYDINRLPDVIEIGKTGEHLFRPIQFNMRSWLTVLPEGVPSVILIRPGETPADSYIAATEFDDGILTWRPTAADVENDGYGHIEVWLEQAAEDPEDTDPTGKSASARTHIEKSIGPAESDPPEAQASWLAQMTALKVATVDAAEDAEDAQEAAEAAQAAAEAAAETYPYIDEDTGDWMVWDVETGAYVDTGVKGHPDVVRVQDAEPTDADGMIWFPETPPASVTVPTVSEMQAAVGGKADKVDDAVSGDFAALDSNGNLTDSGHKHSDYLTAHQDITGKADKVSSATSGNFAGLDSNGNLTDSGHKHSDYITSHQDITGKADKVASATNGNFAGLDSNGNLTDSGKKAADFATPSDIPVLTDLIDDTAGSGDTGKVWSADKSAGEVSDLNTALNSVEESIAPVESTTTATAAHAVGELFMMGETLLVALSAIAVGDTITTTGATPNAAVTTLSAKMIKDVQVNGTSVLTDGVANVPVGGQGTLGVIQLNSLYGVSAFGNGFIGINKADASMIKAGTENNRPIAPSNENAATFYGLAKAAGADMASVSGATVGVYPEAQKSAISQMLDAPETVSGSTPSITAKAGVRYICGEVSTLTITVPASGCIDVVFESGSTATVLTVTPTKSGVTAVKWANGFDPTSLDANTRYEILIDDGEWGMVASWT